MGREFIHQKGSYELGIEFRAPSPEFWGESYDPLGIEAP